MAHELYCSIIDLVWLVAVAAAAVSCFSCILAMALSSGHLFIIFFPNPLQTQHVRPPAHLPGLVQQHTKGEAFEGEDPIAEEHRRGCCNILFFLLIQAC